jgi:hypothetical protein
MTLKHTWNLPPVCCSANSASLGDLMGMPATIYGVRSYRPSPSRAGAGSPGVARLVVFNRIQRHDARRLLSSPLQIAEMSSTVRCAVMANRLARAGSWRSV